MSEDTLDTATQEPNDNLDTDVDGSDDPGDIKTALAQKKHWREKAKAAEERAKQAEDKLKTMEPSSKEGDSVPSQSEKPAGLDPRDYTDLRVDGYNAEEIEKIHLMAKASSKSVREVLEDPFTQAGIEKMREETMSDEATPPSSSRPAPSRVVQSKKPMAEMSKAEKSQVLQDIVKKHSK